MNRNVLTLTSYYNVSKFCLFDKEEKETKYKGLTAKDIAFLLQNLFSSIYNFISIVSPYIYRFEEWKAQNYEPLQYWETFLYLFCLLFVDFVQLQKLAWD